jgi:inosine/xanthosine triphosphatase
MKIALGSNRAAKVMAVRAAVQRIATVEKSWHEASIIQRAVSISVPAMPLTDWELMRGAQERAEAVRELLKDEGTDAQLYVGLEGGFHSVSMEGVWHTFLRGWAYATDGERGSFGMSPSITVPDSIARRVMSGRRELSVVIDEVAGEHDVRSRQGAWGVLSRDLLTRSMSFEAALIAAFAPFYNSGLYT